MYVKSVLVDQDASPSFRVTVVMVHGFCDYTGTAKRMSLTEAKDAAVRDAFEQYIKAVQASITFTVRADVSW